MTTTKAMLAVEVVFATADASDFVRLSIAAGSTLLDAVEQSGLLQRHLEIRVDELVVGVFGRLRAPDEILAGGDRVEIYRPLIAEPKAARVGRVREARRRRAQILSTRRDP